MPPGRGEQGEAREGKMRDVRGGVVLTDGVLFLSRAGDHVAVGEHRDRCDNGARGQSSEYLVEVLLPSPLGGARQLRLLPHDETARSPTTAGG